MPATNRDFHIRVPEEEDAIEIRAEAERRSVRPPQIILERLNEWKQFKKSVSDIEKEGEAGLQAEADRHALEEAIETIHELKYSFNQSHAQLQQRITELEMRLDTRTHELAEQIGKLMLLKLQIDKVEGVAHAVRTYCEQIMIDVVTTPEDVQIREDIIGKVQTRLTQLFYPEELN